ncbi:MAG: SDR family NAD(P)-dependent oxidoreductase [Nocardioides sp.]
MRGVTFDFSGCRALVTGGTRGLGHAVARALAGAGAEVSITGTQTFTSYYDADLTGFHYHRLDLTDADACAELTAELGDIDVLVNAAGCRLPAGSDAIEREFVGHAAGLGLLGPFQLAGKLRLPMSRSRARGGGAVVNLPPVSRWFALAHGADPDVEPRHAHSGHRRVVRPHRGPAQHGPGAAGHPRQRGGFQVQIDRQSGPQLTGTFLTGGMTGGATGGSVRARSGARPVARPGPCWPGRALGRPPRSAPWSTWRCSWPVPVPPVSPDRC